MYREWELPQPEVRCAWSVDTMAGGRWTQPATEFWGLGFSSTVKGVGVEVIGPAAHPQRFEMESGDRFWGVELQAHVFLRMLPKSSFELVQVLPSTPESFRLGERDYAIPDEHGLGVMVDELLAGACFWQSRPWRSPCRGERRGVVERFVGRCSKSPA